MLERLDRLTVRARLMGLATLLAVVVGVVAALTSGTVSRLVGTLDRLSGSSLPALQALADLDASVAMATSEVRGLSVPWLADRRDAVAAALRERLAGVRAAAARFDAIALPEARRREWAELRPKLDAWLAAVEAVTPLLQAAAAGQEEGALAQMRRTAGVAQLQLTHKPVAEGMAALSAAVVEEVGAEARASRGQASRAVAVLLVLIALGGAVAVVVLLLVSRGIARALGALVAEAARVSGAVRAGRLDVRGDPTTTTPEFRPILDGLNATADAFARPIRMAADHIDRLSRGDVPPRITEQYQGDFNAMKDSLNRAIDAVQALVADAATLAEAGVAGRLATRADAGRHQGDFRRVIQGVNDTLDAFARPVEQAAACIEALSRGEVPARLAGGAQGDLARLQDNLNQCLDAVARLVEDADLQAQAGVEGRLGHRADAGRHRGDFRRIVEGVNRSLDAVVGPLQAAARNLDALSRGAVPPRITEEFRGDYAVVKTSVNGCVEAVERLVKDTRALVEASLAGRLQVRADAARHQGDFRVVVEGFNQTLDAVVAPVGEATRALEALAQRDLRARVTGRFEGDHARLQAAVNATGEALHDAMVQVAAAAEQVSSASGQIASSSQAVASGASQQAASIHETVGGLDTVAQVVRRVADHATQANALAARASQAATAGAQSVGEMQGAMAKIRASAEGTSQIIRDINDIAFQTNLLALNAAVEAARAGEAGRGFAVVAEEVRSLALRAKEAATKTEALIKESVRQTGEGEGTAREVAGRLGEIVKGIGEVSAIVSEITAAAREETGGIQQVSTAVGEMDKVTQLNAASAEESSSSAAELSSQAEALAAMVGSFKLARPAGGDGPPGRRGGGPPPLRRAEADDDVVLQRDF